MKLIAACSSILLASPLAAQTTIHVPGAVPTIQLGIAAASDGDTVLVAPGTYVEQIDLLGKAITVRSSGGAAVTTIDSAGGEVWPDFPHGAVVRMIAGEMSDTVLEGFTITGAAGPGFGSGTSGVWCVGLTPTIRDCVVRDNQGGIGAGIAGDAVIVRCEITGNDATPYAEGGGIWGAPTVIDSVIAGNRSGGSGGGLYATSPCTLTGTVIDGNVAGNGFDGYSGGGVFGPATLVRCAITRNTGNHYLSGGPPDTVGTAVDGAVALVHCTVTENVIGGGAVPSDPSGALRNVGSVTNSILWNNENGEVAVGSAPVITYSIVTGGYPGTGNLAADPLFTAPASGDHTLQAGSPAIDAGDPASPLDPDGTTADMGAYPYLQAAATVQPGSGVNPLSYSTTTVPALGTTWTASIDAALHHPSATVAGVVGVLHPIAPLATPFGELLLDPLAVQVIQQAAAILGGSASFAFPVPAFPDLVGLTVHTQGIAVGIVLELTNGIDLFLGN